MIEHTTASPTEPRPSPGLRSSGRSPTQLFARLLLAASAAVAGCSADGGGTETTVISAPPDIANAPTGDRSLPSPGLPSEATSLVNSAQPSLGSQTRQWPSYTATRYGFTVGHPPGWTEVPSSRDWTWETDVHDSLSPAHEAFISPDHAIRVSAWNAPLDTSAPATPIDDLVAWVEGYCERSGNTPCDGIADRAIELCLEARDCHPGLLVSFTESVQAFFSGGIYSSNAMTIVAVWQPESAPQVLPYGGAQRLLESVLSTMEVWRATTPFSERN